MRLARRQRKIVLAQRPCDHIADPNDLTHWPKQVDLPLDVGRAEHIQARLPQAGDQAGVLDHQRDAGSRADLDLVAIP